jgi:hypothetical protein
MNHALFAPTSEHLDSQICERFLLLKLLLDFPNLVVYKNQRPVLEKESISIYILFLNINHVI